MCVYWKPASSHCDAITRLTSPVWFPSASLRQPLESPLALPFFLVWFYLRCLAVCLHEQIARCHPFHCLLLQLRLTQRIRSLTHPQELSQTGRPTSCRPQRHRPHRKYYLVCDFPMPLHTLPLDRRPATVTALFPHLRASIASVWARLWTCSQVKRSYSAVALAALLEIAAVHPRDQAILQPYPPLGLHISELPRPSSSELVKSTVGFLLVLLEYLEWELVSRADER